MTLGALIRERREHLGLTQENLAAEVGVTQSAVAFWESDHSRPGLDNLKILAKALRVTTSKLLAAA